MFTPTSVAQDFSICLRCQYRIAIHHRPRPGRRNRVLDIIPKRRIASSYRSLQKGSHSVSSKEAQENNFSFAQKLDRVKVHQTNQNQREHEDDSSRFTLDMKSLVTPADLALLKTSKNSVLQPVNVEGAIDDQHVNISPTELLEHAQEKHPSVSIEEASTQIEILKATWLSQLQNQHHTLMTSKYSRLLDSLREGFTLAQLKGYYKAEITKLRESVFELALPYSTNLYTRTSWVPGCTPFPQTAQEQLHYLKHFLQHRCSGHLRNDNEEKENTPKSFEKAKNGPRTQASLSENILQVLWNVKVPEQVGELDIWIEPSYFGILYSNRKSMFERLIETGEAKVYVSKSKHLIRITSDKETCCNVFKSIFQTLENINVVSIFLPPGPLSKGPCPHINIEVPKFIIKQIERVTDTIICTDSPSASKKKSFRSSKGMGLPNQYRIFYLGPDEYGLERAKEMLMQASQNTTSILPLVIWNDLDCSQGRPRPIEGGGALPSVARSVNWSRWSSPLKREAEEHLVGESPDLSPGCSQSLLSSIFDLLFQHATPYSGKRPWKSDFWSGSPKLETFASFGQVGYPDELVRTLHWKLETTEDSAKPRMIRHHLDTQRQFFCGFSGLRFMLENVHPSMQVGEDLRIRLTPSPEVFKKEKVGRIFPDVELRVKCDLASKTCEFSGARLIFDRREVDVLLPTEIVDIRFCSTSHIPSLAKTTPQILDFLSASNVNVFAQEAIAFPGSLILSIPATAIRKRPKAGRPVRDEFLSFTKRVWQSDPQFSLEYVLSNYEHWSYMSGDIMGLNFESGVVTGWKTGKREEFRMALPQEEGLKPDQTSFNNHVQTLWEIIQKLRIVKHARGTERNTATSLVSDDLETLQKDESVKSSMTDLKGLLA